MLNDMPRLYPGVTELITELRDRFRLAIVSTSWRENIVTVLTASGLSDAFEWIVAKEDVSAVKPDPTCYRLALKHLAIPASAAIALEDSPVGVAAAQAASIRVVAVGHRRAEGTWTGGAPYVATLDARSLVYKALGIRARRR